MLPQSLFCTTLCPCSHSWAPTYSIAMIIIASVLSRRSASRGLLVRAFIDVKVDHRQYHSPCGFFAKRKERFSREPAYSFQRFPAHFYGCDESCSTPPPHAVRFYFFLPLSILTDLIRFFIHLVDVLGPEEFLSVVCMLIVAKADKRLVRLQGRDLRAALALPLSLLQHYPSNIQLPVGATSFFYHTRSDILSFQVLIEILNEAQRLIIGVISPDFWKTGSTLLGDS